MHPVWDLVPASQSQLAVQRLFSEAGFNSDVSHPIRKKHITNYVQNQQNISSHPGFKKPGIPAFVPKAQFLLFQLQFLCNGKTLLYRKL